MIFKNSPQQWIMHQARVMTFKWIIVKFNFVWLLNTSSPSSYMVWHLWTNVFFPIGHCLIVWTFICVHCKVHPNFKFTIMSFLALYCLVVWSFLHMCHNFGLFGCLKRSCMCCSFRLFGYYTLLSCVNFLSACCCFVLLGCVNSSNYMHALQRICKFS
jgi:hypothetical protein